MLRALVSLQLLLSRLTTPRAGIRYRIGGRVYRQRPLVLLQLEQLVEFVNPETFAGLKAVNAVGIVRLLGEKIASILAIVLIPEGVPVEDRDLQEITAHLRANVDIETAAKVVEGFLSCNRVASVFDRLTGMLTKGGALTTGITAVTGSASSSASSPAAT